MKHFKLYLVILFLASGCSTQSQNTGLPSLKPEVAETELNYLANSPKSQLGLALSGGGTRSASFNIGLMAGLNEAGLLNDFDYISSVSGGSYAAFWYYTKLYWSRMTKEHVTPEEFQDVFEVCYPNKFKNDDAPIYRLTQEEQNGPVLCNKGESTEKLSRYRFQAHLHNNFTLARYWSASNSWNGNLDPWITGSAYTWRFFGIAVARIADVSQASRLLNYNYSPGRFTYRNSLERTFGFYPDESNAKGIIRSGKYINRGRADHRLEKFTMSSLRKIFSPDDNYPRPPIWIINSTADVNNYWPRWLNSEGNVPDYRNSVFEFTPFYYGNDFYGYSDSLEFSKNISEAVQASGAASDSASPYNSFLADVFTPAFPLGNYVNIGKNNVYLTDGGHSENLAVYSLIKRKVPVIVISDAEYDPNGTLEGIMRLKEKLYKQHSIILEIENVTDLAKLPTQDYKSDDPPPLVLKGYLKDSKTCTEIAKIYYVKLRLVRKWYECKDVSAQEQQDCYPEYLKKFIDFNKKYKKGENPFNEKFPHTGTGDIAYSATQYLAYYTLGRHFGRSLVKTLQDENY